MISRSSQLGSSLLFAMIFLLILSVLALSTMNTSYLDEKMAANTQFKNQVFQAGQSEGQGQYDHYRVNYTYMADALKEGLLDDPAEVNPPAQIDHSNIAKDIELTFIKFAQPPTGFSFDIFQGVIYDQDTAASLEGTSSSSDQTLGINYAAPKNQTKI